MIYNGNVKKQTGAVYEQDNVHKMEQEQVAGACRNVQIETHATYQKKDIKVVLEFPAEADLKAEEEISTRLKEVYLRKIKFGAMQVEEVAVQCTPPVAGAESKKNNLEDKDYE